ncbi:ligand-binding sensor domain-containing protein [Rurimicrobium arvi]|uniref:Two component regulator propeller n=1 Tax=Rurimicrobium arvi TaxID=2049916 RepID=A0ABP8MRZ7_9BACT
MLRKTQGSGKEQNVHCMLEDSKGNLWFGTTGEGVFCYDGSVFTQFTTGDGLASNIVWCMLEDARGNIWLGTDKGLSLFDGEKFSPVAINVFRAGGISMIAQQDHDPVWSLLRDRNGVIWIATSKDLYRYKSGNFSRVLDDTSIQNTQHLSLASVQCMLEDNSGVIWMGSGPPAMEGLIRLERQTLSASRPNGDGWIRNILSDASGKIWLGGRSHGNFVFDGSRFQPFTSGSGIGNALLADASGNIWFNGEEKLSTVNSKDGIWRYKAPVFTHFSSKDGMSDYFVFSMLADSKGNIWFGTRNCGLYRYDGRDFKAFSE